VSVDTAGRLRAQANPMDEQDERYEGGWSSRCCLAGCVTITVSPSSSKVSLADLEGRFAIARATATIG
jgi:hypothetical protein